MINLFKDDESAWLDFMAALDKSDEPMGMRCPEVLHTSLQANGALVVVYLHRGFSMLLGKTGLTKHPKIRVYE